MTIRIDQPRPFDLVGDTIEIGGVATGFEATITYRVHDGHDEVTGFLTVGGGTGEHAQFHAAVDVSGHAFQLDRLFVEVLDEGGDATPVAREIVPVILATRIVQGYVGYREHTVQPGETLSAIARIHYEDAGAFRRIVRANPTVVGDPNLIFPGQVLRVPIGA